MHSLRSFLILSLLLAALSTPAQQPRILDLTSPDGATLKASFFPAAKLGPGLLLLHQCNRQRKVWDDLAQKFAASGINVLTFDFRGFGESAGPPFDKLSNDQIQDLFDKKFPLDVDTAYKFLASQPSVTPTVMAAGGASCGVNQAVLLASRHPEVKALVLLSEATFRPGREFLRKNPNLPLFAAVADDDPDPAVVEFMEWIYSFSTNPINKFEHFPKGGHGVELFALHKDLPTEIVTWLTNALSPFPAIPATRAPALAEHQNHFLNLLDDPANIPNAPQLFAEAHQRYPKEVIFSEPVLNRLGYEYLQSGNNPAAIALFKLNVTAYPDSPNVYDSLADAYIATGQKDLARQNEQKTLDLLAHYTKYSEAESKALREAAQKKLTQLSSPPH
jgi:pimeloyl-ACP methyl ester carboxylesterase